MVRTRTDRGSEGSNARSLFATVQSYTGSPLLYIGAVTVVVAIELAELLPTTDFWTALAVFPIALALLYGQLTLLVVYRDRRGARARCARR